MSGRFAIVAVVILQSAAVLTQERPEIDYISRDQVKNVSDTAELQCSVKNNQEYVVKWFKNNANNLTTIRISTGISLSTTDARFSIHYDNATSTYTLRINDLQLYDAGLYFCEINITPSTKVFAGTELNIIEAPYIRGPAKRSVDSIVGRSIVLQCDAEGYPVPRVSWRRENNAVFASGKTTYRGNMLEIAHLRRSDRGVYFCQAENGAGRNALMTMKLEVAFKPVIETPHPRVGKFSSLEDVFLTCLVEAYPPPEITWLKNDAVLNNHQTYNAPNILTGEDTYATTNATYRVIGVDKEQFGDYVCRASNMIGTAEAKIEVYRDGVVF